MACFLVHLSAGWLLCSTTSAGERFKVEDDIATSYFGDSYYDLVKPATLSPDGRYFIAATNRGNLETNQAETTLRVYRTEDIREFLKHSQQRDPPKPFWVLTKGAFGDGKNGSIIAHVRWLKDSTQFAFLAKSGTRHRQLFIADIRDQSDHALTPGDREVINFDFHDEQHFVYTVSSTKMLDREAAENRAEFAVGNDRSILELMFAEDFMRDDEYDLVDLWAVLGGRKFRVENAGRPLPLHSSPQAALALSPDGKSVVTQMVIADVPQEWATRYPPPYPSDPYGLKAGHQDPEAYQGQTLTSRHVSINLEDATVTPLIDAPTGMSVGWWGDEGAEWSEDGKWLLLSNTFVPDGSNASSKERAGPCRGVVLELSSGGMSCLGHSTSFGGEDFEAHLRYITRVSFQDSDKRVGIEYEVFSEGGRKGVITYRRDRDGGWSLVGDKNGRLVEEGPLRLSIAEDLNAPPVLVATDSSGRSRVILDPNPHLRNIELGRASVFKWKDPSGGEWLGGLFLPPDYVPGRRYPLVVQTHGFQEHKFEPSGLYPTAFAARELAGVGIAVLQAPMCHVTSPREGPCQVAGFAAGVQQLVDEGIVDPQRVGIVGFSRSCYAVLEALTTSPFHYSAASITNGVDMSYLQYLSHLNISAANTYQRDFEAVNGGAQPFAAGLQEWMRRAPGFHMDQVTTPLQATAQGRVDLLEEWEPYALLRSMDKPVELILLTQAGTHVLSNPRQRMISQGGTVDWMRFWLQGYEDPGPAKADQYHSWEHLCDLQVEQNPDTAAFCVHTRH